MDRGPETIQQSPIITRPEDEALLAKLERKKQEYLQRIGDEFTHPEQAIVMGLAVGSDRPLDAYIKHSLLTRVLEEGAVSTWEFSKYILEDPTIASISIAAMPQVMECTAAACGVIDAYCSNNTAAVIGGTGLH